MTDKDFIRLLRTHWQGFEATAQAILKGNPLDARYAVLDAIVDVCEPEGGDIKKGPRYRNNGKRPGSAKTWFTRCVQRRARKNLRHLHQMRRDANVEVPFPEEGIARDWEEQTNLRLDVQKALAALAPEERDLAEQVFLLGHDPQVIAGYYAFQPEYLEWDAKVLTPLKVKLRALLADYGHTPEPERATESSSAS